MIAAGGINANAKVSVDSTYEVLDNFSKVTFTYDSIKQEGNTYTAIANSGKSITYTATFNTTDYVFRTHYPDGGNTALQLGLGSTIDISSYDRLVIEFDSIMNLAVEVGLCPITDGGYYYYHYSIGSIASGKTKYVLDLTDVKKSMGNTCGAICFMTSWGWSDGHYDFKSIRFEKVSYEAEDYEEIDYSTGYCLSGDMALVNDGDYYVLSCYEGSSKWAWDISDIGAKNNYQYLVVVPRKSFENGGVEYIYGISDDLNEITGWGFAYGEYQFHRGLAYDLKDDAIYSNSGSTSNVSSPSTDSYAGSYLDSLYRYTFKDTITIYVDSTITTSAENSTSTSDTTYIYTKTAVDNESYLDTLTYTLSMDTTVNADVTLIQLTTTFSDYSLSVIDSVYVDENSNVTREFAGIDTLFTLNEISEFSVKRTWYSSPTSTYEISAVYFTNQKPTYTNAWESTNDLAADYVRTAYNADTYGTICLPYASAVCGAYVYDIVGVDSLYNPKTLYLQEVKGVLEAGKGYLFISNTNRYAYADTETASSTNGQTVTNAQYGGDVCFYRAGADTVTAVVGGALIGNLWSDTLTVKSSTDSLFYVLTSSIENNDTTYTFMKANSTSGNKVPQYRAYLNLTKSLVVSEEEAEQNVESKKWIKLSLATDGDDTTTGISEIASEEQNARIDDDIIYNLNGIRVTNPSKGIYIKNGKKYIIK